MRRVVCCLLLLIACVANAAKNDRPNIVLIFADDLGYSDIGCFGGEIETPNIDRLATNGVRFTQFYNSSRCCPTRASLLTGVYPHQAGIGHMMEDLGPVGYRGQLNHQSVTIPEVLKTAGYHTAMSGKWHVAHIKFTGKPQLNFENQDPFWTEKSGWPMQRGFEEYFGTVHGVNSFFDPFSLVRRNEVIRPEGKNFYYTDAISDNAIQFIDKFTKEKRPFFLYVAYTAPHWPLQALPEDIKKYEGRYKIGWDNVREQRHQRMIQLGIIDKGTPLSPRNPKVPAWDDAPNKDWEAHRMAVYAAMVDRMDQGIGRIMKKLKEAKVDDNTVMIFLSDNGACAENNQPNWYDVPTKTRDGRPVQIGNSKTNVLAGPDDVWQSVGPAWANASNTPYRLYKHWSHEGGICTPMIFSWAKVGKRGRIENTPGHVIDFMKTFVELSGAEYPKKFAGENTQPMEGMSLIPIVTGKAGAKQDRVLGFEHEGNRALRQGKWKLVAEHKRDWELYNLESDRAELNNLASKNPEKVKELAAAYEKWAEHCNVLPWDVVMNYKKENPKKK